MAAHFHDRQRVAVGAGQHAVYHRRVERHACGRAQQVRRRIVGQPADLDGRKLGERRRLVLIADREDDSDPVGVQTARDESQYQGRLGIHPLGVVDRAQHWLIRGRAREQRQAGQPDEETIWLRAGLQAESHPQRLALRRRKFADQRQERDEQLMHAAVLQTDLRLNGREGRDSEPGRRADRIARHGRLAHSVTATEHQHSAEPPPDEFQELVDGFTLGATVQQWPLGMLPPARDGDPSARCLSTWHPARIGGHTVTPCSQC